MKVLLFTGGYNALGETFTLALFAQELMDKGNNCCFISPKLSRDYLLTFGINEDIIHSLPVIPKDKRTKDAFDSNYAIFKQIIDGFSPDIAVVADWHHYDENGMASNGSYFIYWLDDSIPIVTFDHLGFAPLGLNKQMSEVNRQILTNTLFFCFQKTYLPMSDRYSHIIRPCPHHPNISPGNNQIFYWGIMKDKIVNNTIHLPSEYFNNSKVVFQPVGIWQEGNLSKTCELRQNIEYNYYKETLIPIISRYLVLLDQNITYIVISGKIKERRMFSEGKVKVVFLPPLKHHEFMSYLQSADLFLTDNLMSSSLGKAVFCKVPSLTLRSSIYVNSDGKIQTPFQLSPIIEEKLLTLKDFGLLYPFYSFPLGMCELEKMYENNNFTHCFDIAEIFNEEECVDYLHKLLYNKQYIRRKQEIQQQYIMQNRKLMNAIQILEKCR